tara:strand:- start:1229 stop:1888 length:660 start_codon:yes stop_codon:yes gene_type:complete
VAIKQDRYKLPENPNLKDINKYKRELNWNEYPPFYHMVSSAIANVGGLLQYGFDNPVSRIVNKQNWNLDKLGGYTDENGKIVCETAPRLLLRTAFNDRGFELYAFPYSGSRPTDEYINDNPSMEFSTWDPGYMRLLIRIPEFEKFIHLSALRGDDADRALIEHAHVLIVDVIRFLNKHMRVVEISGPTVKAMHERYKKYADSIHLKELFGEETVLQMTA